MKHSRIPIEHHLARRQRLAQLIPGCALVLPAWPEQYRNADGHYNYRCESSLYYLTGFEEPESCLVFRPGHNPETVLFVRPKNLERETWDGFRFGLEGSKQHFKVDATFDIHDFEKIAPDLLRGSQRIYYSLFRNTQFDAIFGRTMLSIHGWRPRFGLHMPPIEDANGLMSELRIHKTEEEAEMMRVAGRISAEGHVALMKAAKPGISERALHAAFIKTVMELGAIGEAYGGIVASGDNATTLHYRFNDAICADGELVLADLGAEYNYYSGDITRTFPVNGRFSPLQRRLYEKVLRVQKDLIAMVKPGLPHYDLQKFTITKLTEVLLEEGLLQGEVEANIKNGAYTRFYPHGVSHLLGLDTHDLGVLQIRGQSRPIEAGWCLTIEPGLYFPASDETIPAEYRGIGIRIEDDILVTHDGAEVLTKDVPKEVDEIEQLLKG